MFIPVPIKAKYFVPVIVLLDLFSGVTGYSILVEILLICHVGGALIEFYYDVVLEEKINSIKTVGIYSQIVFFFELISASFLNLLLIET